jgi:integrase
MPRISKRFVDGLQPAETDYFRWDDALHGFGVRVRTSRRKVYVLQYRAGGRTRRVGLGVHGSVTPDEARRHARELLGRVARREDPAEEIRNHRRAPTIGMLCDRFMQEYVPQLKPSTRAEYRRSVELFIKPRIGSLQLIDVKRADVARLRHDLRHIPYQANRTLGVLSSMFTLAAGDWGLLPDGFNPCWHVTRYPERKRERFLTPDEYERLWATLAELEAEQPAMLPALNAIRLLALTGCRLSEIQKLRWEHVRDATLELPDGKNGARRVYLGPAAVNVLRSIERLPDNPFVITGQRPGSHLTDLQRPWRRIRARADLPGVRIHDLRHSFASEALRNGESLPVIGKLLGHKQVQTTARYAHLADESLRTAANRVSTAMSAIIGDSER